jgi:hypothetical protein
MRAKICFWPLGEIDADPEHVLSEHYSRRAGKTYRRGRSTLLVVSMQNKMRLMALASLESIASWLPGVAKLRRVFQLVQRIDNGWPREYL